MKKTLGGGRLTENYKKGRKVKEKGAKKRHFSIENIKKI